jgi:murein DD-endopeptidase MepM/ murein hydrolase activator NlpD
MARKVDYFALGMAAAGIIGIGLLVSALVEPGLPAGVVPPRPIAHPLKAQRFVSSNFGPRINPVTKKAHDHTGIDLPAPEGTPVLAVEEGRVIRVDRNAAVNGNAVFIKGARSGLVYAYLHLSFIDPIAALKGATIGLGKPVGRVGSTGRSTGPHLHLQVEHNGKPIDPELLFPEGTFEA